MRIALADVLQGREPDVRPLLDTLGRAPMAPADAARLQSLIDERETLLPEAGALADRGDVSAMRAELAAMEQLRPAATADDIQTLAKEIQGRERISYKSALVKARKQVAGDVTDFAARQERVRAGIDANARAQQAFDRLSVIDREIVGIERTPRPAPTAPVRTAIAAAADGALRPVDTAMFGAQRAVRAQEAIETARGADPATRSATSDPAASRAADERLQDAAKVEDDGAAKAELDDAMQRLNDVQRVLEDRGMARAVDLSAWDAGIAKANAIGKGLQDMALCRFIA